MNRLTHAEGPYGTIDYTYDGVGNRQTKSEGGTATSYTYYPATNRLHEAVTGAENINYAFDPNGNITGIGNRTLTYNQDNRLVRAEEGGTVLGEYTYNGFGQRIIKNAGGTTTVFLYDFDGNIIAETDQTGSILTEYLYKGSSRLAMVDVLAGKMYYYGNDKLGAPQIMTDATNTVVWEADYKPFGEADVNPNSTVANNFRFPGQYFDAETGLHYNYHRYYDPNTGRYVTPDPIEMEGGINLFAYVLNNPLTSVDPKGLDPGCENDPCKNLCSGFVQMGMCVMNTICAHPECKTEKCYSSTENYGKMQKQGNECEAHFTHYANKVNYKCPECKEEAELLKKVDEEQYCKYVKQRGGVPPQIKSKEDLKKLLNILETRTFRWKK